MKKFYLVVTTLFLVTALSAQRIEPQVDFAKSVRPVTEAEAAQAHELGRQLQEQRVERGGDIFFYEDFANGYDGNTPFGAWTSEDSGGNVIWQVAGTDSPAGEWSGNAGTIGSTSEDNGWMIFDADGYNTQFAGANEGQIDGDEAYEEVEGWLTSPVMDMSGLSSVIIEWEQYFRYCCFPFSPMTLEVTNDGGTSWVEFDAEGDFIESANVQSATPQFNSIDVSCVAAGETEVQFRFAYRQAPETGNGYSHYFWGVDDVTVRENETASDIQLTQLATGDIFNYFEYRHIPLSQAIAEDEGGLVAGVIYRNAGFEDQTNTIITVEVLDADDNVVATVASDPFVAPSAANAETCPANPQDTLYIETGWAPGATGDFTLRASITSENVDGDDTNNELQKPVSYNEDEYGHDDEASWDVEFGARFDNQSGQFDPTGYGNFFTNPNEGDEAHGILVAFGPDATPFTEFEIRLYELSPGVFLNDADFETAYHVLAPEYVPDNIGSADWHYYPFDDPIEMNVANPNDLNDDFFYFAGVINDFESDGDFTVVGNGNSETDNSTGVYERAGDGSFIWFTSQTATPAVRLIMSDRVAIDEIADLNGVDLLQNMPNPASDVTTIRFYLETAKEVTLEIVDAQGRIIQSIDRGTLGAGSYNEKIDVSRFSNGVYYYTLIADGARITKQMVIAGK